MPGIAACAPPPFPDAMLQTLRSKILAISTATVVCALAITGAATYHIVRGSTFQTIEQDLDAITAGNTMAIDQWVAAKGLAVRAAAGVIEHGDPQGFAAHMGQASGFPITTVGWEDKSFKSTTSTPPDYDPTARPWYKTAVQAGKLTLTKPYGDSTTGVPYVAFVAPMMRDGALQGVISGAVPLDGVREVVSAIRPTPGSLGFVVSRDGQVLAHADTKLLLKPAADISPLLTPQALAGLATATEPLEVELGGSAKLLKARPVQGTDWLLVVALDKAEATSGLRSVLQTLGIAIVLLALLAAAVSAALTTQSFRRLSQVRDAMDKIGSGGGDLTQRLPVSGRDEVAQIAASFNAFVEQIGSVLKDVRGGVESMKTATDEIKLGNLDLSNRTEESASSLQQTSASLSQLTANVRQSAEAAAMATRLAQTASASATKGGEVVGGAVSTMDDISRASSKIGEIIGVIDAIAFQTNILALNAAVEAARAGEQGRGFAVVASEVRSLAHRSATAAKEIKALIDASGASVAIGTQRVRAAGQTMGEIVDGIQRVSQIIVEINGAMTEQSVGIGQINQAVAEMDRATQQNAALVEESTAASSVLNEQAHHLSRTVAGFTLDGRAPAREQLLLTT
jgi:methyl-accepting chemotaxis protein